MSGELEAALAHAARGWRVLPLHDVVEGSCSCRKGSSCPTPGKHPRVAKWRQTASADPGTIGGWWEHWPTANVGILTGSESGLVVVDVDPRNGGFETLAAFIAENGRLPETVVARTGGDGLHYYFAHPGGRVEGFELGDGLELKGDGQLVVAPPSQTGGEAGRPPHRWERGPGEHKLAPSPTWPRPSKEKNSAAPLEDEIVQGGRHRKLLSLAGSMRRRGMTAEELVVALGVVNQARCKPPLAVEEIVDIAKDVADRYDPAPPDPDRDRLEREADRLLGEWTPAGPPRDEGGAEPRAHERRQTTPLIISLVEFLGGSEDDAAWLVDHLAARGALVVVAGLPKVGKSTFVYGLLGALTSTSDWFVGLPAGSTSALLMTEEPPATVEEKVDRFGIKDEHVFVISKRRMGAGRAWAKTIAATVAFCRARPEVGIVVVDTLDKFADLSPSQSESDTGVVREMIDPLYPLLDLGVCVILITHQRKAEGEYGLRVRGGTALTGSVDVIVEVERPTQSAGLSKAARVVKIVSRFAGAPDEMAVELDADGWRSLGTVKAAARRSRRGEILALLDDELLTLEEITGRADGPSKDTVRRRLGELVEKGLSERLGDGKRSDPYRWRLSENGRIFLRSPDFEASAGESRNLFVQAENGPSDFFASNPPPRGEAACKETLECPLHEGLHAVTGRAAGLVYLACGCHIEEDL